MQVMNDDHEEDDKFLEEFDDKVRSCKVCLRLKPTENHSHLKIILASWSLKHWAIVCAFKGSSNPMQPFFNASSKISGGKIGPW